MSDQEIKERIKKLIINHVLDEDDSIEIENDQPLMELGIGIDSVSTLEFLVALENEFGINIDESSIEIETLENVESISDFVGGMISKQ
ncbi:MAG: acyl carrier protein [Thermodesulfobacteriota bacterium]